MKVKTQKQTYQKHYLPIRDKKLTDGITLIALVVTIVVLLILAGITINFLMRGNSVLSEAQNAREQQEIANLRDKISMEVLVYKKDKVLDENLGIDALWQQLEDVGIIDSADPDDGCIDGPDENGMYIITTTNDYEVEIQVDDTGKITIGKITRITGTVVRVRKVTATSSVSNGKTILNLTITTKGMESEDKVIVSYKEVGASGNYGGERELGTGETVEGRIEDLTAGKEYEILVQIKDKDGNEKANKKVKILAGKLVESITLNETNINKKVGEEVELTATVDEDSTLKEVEWSNNNSKVVNIEVNSEDANKVKITTKDEGTAIITATAKDGGGAKATCTITVKNMDIYTASDLELFRDLVDGGTTFNGSTVTLMDNIDLSEVCSSSKGSWTPIGEYTSMTDYKAFEGIFDGQGHTISNIYINNPSGNRQALFELNAGTINNLTVEGNITGGIGTAGICGASLGGTITNCTNKATISGQGSSGGICGLAKNGINITNCSNEGTISGNGISTGGICGYIEGTSTNKAKITNCSNRAIVISTGDTVGGICGYGKEYIEISNCYNAKERTGETRCVQGAWMVGGIAGYLGGGSKVNCVRNDGVVYATGACKEGDTLVGGIVGGIDMKTNALATKVEMVYNTGAVTGKQSVGGIIGLAVGKTGAKITVEYAYSEETPSLLPGGQYIQTFIGSYDYINTDHGYYPASNAIWQQNGNENVNNTIGTDFSTTYTIPTELRNLENLNT